MTHSSYTRSQARGKEQGTIRLTPFAMANAEDQTPRSPASTQSSPQQVPWHVLLAVRLSTPSSPPLRGLFTLTAPSLEELFELLQELSHIAPLELLTASPNPSLIPDLDVFRRTGEAVVDPTARGDGSTGLGARAGVGITDATVVATAADGGTRAVTGEDGTGSGMDITRE